MLEEGTVSKLAATSVIEDRVPKEWRDVKIGLEPNHRRLFDLRTYGKEHELRLDLQIRYDLTVFIADGVEQSALALTDMESANGDSLDTVFLSQEYLHHL